MSSLRLGNYLAVKRRHSPGSPLTQSQHSPQMDPALEVSRLRNSSCNILHMEILLCLKAILVLMGVYCRIRPNNIGEAADHFQKYKEKVRSRRQECLLSGQMQVGFKVKAHYQRISITVFQGFGQGDIELHLSALV